MWSRKKATRCLWTSLLTITVAGCVGILLLYLKYSDINRSEQISHIVSQGKLTEECIPFCDSTECVTYAKFLLGNMKESDDPCENVHTFACGAYEQKFGIEESRSAHFDAEKTQFQILKNILENIQADPESASGKLKTLYDSCMDYVSLEKNAVSTAQDLLNNVGLSNWPHLAPDFKFVNTDVPTVLGNLKARGELGFMMFMAPPQKLDYDYSPDNRTYSMTIRIDIRYFNYLMRSPKKSAIFHILDYFGLDMESVEEIWNDYNSVRDSVLNLISGNYRDLDLECPEAFKDEEVNGCKVSKACRSPFYDNPWINDVRQRVEKSNFTCSDAIDDLAGVCKFVEVFLQNSPDLSNRIDKDVTYIEAGDDHFVLQIIPTLMNFTDRTIANFLAVDFYLRHLHELNFYFQYTKKSCFASERCMPWKPSIVLDRWHFCTQWLSDNMQFAVVYEFQKNYLTSSVLREMLDFIAEYKSEVTKVIARQSWIEKRIKRGFKLSLRAATFNLAPLNEYQLRADKYEYSMNEYYKKFHPKADNFFHNTMELRRATSELHLLLSPIDHFLMQMKFERQALYFCGHIQLHIGVLVPPHYIPGLPKLMNLILFSVFPSHEIGHYIDEIIMNLGNDKKPQERRSELEKCLGNQYSQFKYEFAEENLNGDQYVYENTADNVFTLVVDKLIDKYVLSHEDILLPGLRYSFKQLMYVAVNQLWCSKVSEKEELMYRKGIDHSPQKLRAVGPMQNSRGFPEAFNCSTESFMNPSTKCSYFNYEPSTPS